MMSDEHVYIEAIAFRLNGRNIDYFKGRNLPGVNVLRCKKIRKISGIIFCEWPVAMFFESNFNLSKIR